MKTNEIKFYWNGIKVNGGKLIRCFYFLDNSEDGPAVSISAKGYEDLPRDVFQVQNDTDYYTDYFDNDRATLTPDHPLYKFARFAALKCERHDIEHSIKYHTQRRDRQPAGGRYWAMYDGYVKEYTEKLHNLEPMQDPGQPTAADLAAIEAANVATENARLAAEHEAEIQRREEVQRQKNEGRKMIEATAAEHPLKDGEPVVTIQWSENPAFYSWEDGELRLSVAAAEIILSKLDKARAEANEANGGGGYDKTSFLITWTDESGESTYEGRYDLGDNDGGMIAHIREYGEYYKDADVLALADRLATFTASAQVVSVSFAPWVEQAIEAQREMKKNIIDDTFDMVQMLTDEQLESAVMAIDPKTGDKDVARFFLQCLADRDRAKALDCFRRWRENA